MKNRLWIAALLASSLVPGLARAAGAELNVIRALQVGEEGKATQLTIAGSKAPTFTVFRLSDPNRVVVDLAGADVSAVRGEKAGQGAVSSVAVSQFSDEHATVGRIVVAMASDARYDVKAQGNDVVVSVSGDKAPKAEAAPAPAAEPAAVAAAEPTVEAAPAAAPAADPNVVATRRDEKKVKNPAKKVESVSFRKAKNAVTVSLALDGDVGTYEVIELGQPPRLAVDLFGVEKAPRAAQKAPAGSLVKEVRFGKHEDKVRVVLDASEQGAMPKYDIQRTGHGLSVTLKSAVVEAAPAVAAAEPRVEAKPEPVVAKAEPKVEPKAEPVVAKAEPKKAAKLAGIKDVTFKGDEVKGKVVVAGAKGAEYEVSRPDVRTAVLTLKGAALPKRLERSLDTSAFGGPVKMVSSFVAPGESDAVQIVATLDGKAEDKVSVDAAGQLTWEFKGEAKEKTADGAEMVLDGRKIAIQEESAASSPKAGAFASEAGEYAMSGAPQKAKYTGRRVSFEFKDIDIHNLLRIIAEVSKRNVIVADNVSGKVTIRLRNVPWDQALDLILKSKGLDKEETGNIIRIAPLKELEEERAILVKAREAREKVEPLKVRLIPVNYATAAQISDKVKDMLSARGTMNVDGRTNVIIVKDTQEVLARAEGLVRRLDTQTPQVLIEGRIVEASTTWAREFGIQWGGSVSLAPSTGNPTGLIFPNVVRMAGASSSEGTLGTADNPNYAVNMPAPIGAGSGGGVGFIFGSAGGAVALNLRLTAMESNGQIKTISAPKITTLDNMAATIGQGVSIPFSQVSAAGVNTTFVEAKLELKVTPHVTADGSVLLAIVATNNQPDPGNAGANGQPAISKKEANTNVLVKDGDTTVIGGIYTRSQAKSEAGVPVFSKIPVLGWLFKKNREVDNRTELLIFITPRIVNRNQVVAASEPAAQ